MKKHFDLCLCVSPFLLASCVDRSFVNFHLFLKNYVYRFISTMDKINGIESSGNKSGDVVKKYYYQFVQSNCENGMPIKSTNETGTNIQDLNENCLLKIFSVESLSLMDLCSLADTCIRFQRIVQQCFPKKLVIGLLLDHKYSLKSYSSSGRMKIQSDHSIEIILSHFGSALCEIELWGTVDTTAKLSFVLNLLSKYCVESEIESLDSSDIKRKKARKVLPVKSQPTFNRLQVLHVRSVEIKGCSDLFADFESLIELSLFYVKSVSSILETIFPKLERFSIEGDKVDEFLLENFIWRHPRLKTLHSHTPIPESSVTSFLQGISNSCQELEELSLNFRIENDHFKEHSLLPLQSLKRLKTLKLSNGSCRDLSFVPALTNLRELNFFLCDPLEDNQFAYLAQLTKLRIAGRPGLDVIDVIKRLINLEECGLEDVTLNEKTFSEIVRIVKVRPHVLTMKCDFDFFYDSEKCDENQKVRLVPIFDW